MSSRTLPMWKAGRGVGRGTCSFSFFAVSLSSLLVMAFTPAAEVGCCLSCVVCGSALLGQPEYTPSETLASVGRVPFSEICSSIPRALLSFGVLMPSHLPSVPAALG